MAALQVIRLTSEQMAFRAVPVLQELSEASPSSLASAPFARQEGNFNAFKMGADQAEVPWVVS